MDIHRQQCQACGSHDARNIIVRPGHERPIIYVRCMNCGELVARYRLAEYYHHGKDIESFLRSRGANAVESGRRMLDEFQQVQKDAVEGYEKALEYLTEHDKPV